MNDCGQMKFRIRKLWGKNVLGKVENNIIIQILNTNKKIIK